jgi:hypothetical protein
MKYQLGADTGSRRVLHLVGCPLAKFPHPTLEGLVTDAQVINALGASVEWTSGCERCMPKLSRRIAAARIRFTGAGRH